MKRTFLAAALIVSFANLANADDALLMLTSPSDDVQSAGDLNIPDLASLLEMEDDAEANTVLKDDDLMTAFDATQSPEEAEAACFGWGGYRRFSYGYGYRHHYRSYCYPRYYRTYTYHCAPTYYVPICYTGYWCY